MDTFNFFIFLPNLLWHSIYLVDGLSMLVKVGKGNEMWWIVDQTSSNFNDIRWHVEIEKNNDETSKIHRNSPYCIVRIIFKFLIGSGFDSTSNSSITTDVTRLDSSADAAFIVFSTFPWSMRKNILEREKEEKRVRKWQSKKSTYWIIWEHVT